MRTALNTSYFCILRNLQFILVHVIHPLPPRTTGLFHEIVVVNSAWVRKYVLLKRQTGKNEHGGYQHDIKSTKNSLLNIQTSRLLLIGRHSTVNFQFPAAVKSFSPETGKYRPREFGKTQTAMAKKVYFTFYLLKPNQAPLARNNELWIFLLLLYFPNALSFSTLLITNLAHFNVLWFGMIFISAAN